MAKKTSNTIHFISVECYPAAKVGGLADVVGALPKYLNKLGSETTVFLPKYKMKWFEGQKFDQVYASSFPFGDEKVSYSIEKRVAQKDDFELVVISIPNYFDREGVYAGLDGIFFKDEVERFIVFQRAYLDYVLTLKTKPSIVHCHDHHTGLIPFMMQFCHSYKRLAKIPTVFTIHNQRYQGQFEWDKQNLLPEFDAMNAGMLEWGGVINPLASAVKCSWKITTVSPSYMEELKVNSFGLEWLFNNESGKSVGILNGIDDEVWNPKKDDFIATKMKTSIAKFKSENKKALLSKTKLDIKKPLISFIGRFAFEKGSDLLPDIITKSIGNGLDFNFLILGTGDKNDETAFAKLSKKHGEKVIAYITYNEKLSHQIYAGSDFLIMPSRVEPCGLNQMYAMQYGTIPIVHNLGGLKDSIDEINSEDGTGYKFNSLDSISILEQLQNAEILFQEPKRLTKIRENAVKRNLSWKASAARYVDIYKEILNK